MSYDLMVFERSKAPASKLEFMRWYEEQVDWDDNWNYEDESNTAPALRAWFLEIIKTYPPMNGKYAPSEEALEEDETLEDRMTDYSIGENIIYAAFSWDECADAYELSLSLAKKHGLGFFDVSEDDGHVILSDDSLLE